MKTFKLRATVSTLGFIYVDAESYEDAKNKVENEIYKYNKKLEKELMSSIEVHGQHLNDRKSK